MSTALEFTRLEDDLPYLEQLDSDTVAEVEDHRPVSVTSVVEMLLKDRARLNLLLRNEDRQRELIPPLMAIAITGFMAYGFIVTGILNAFRVGTGFWLPHVPQANWNDFTVGNLALSYTLGLIAANGICLPSFYFYGLLAGIKTTMLSMTAHALKGMAAGAIALVGSLPIYVAVALTAIVFPWVMGSPMVWSILGLALPFVAGTWGAVNLYEGLVGLADTMKPEFRRDRSCFLRRLIFAWVGCYTFITPFVIYSLWDVLSGMPK